MVRVFVQGRCLAVTPLHDHQRRNHLSGNGCHGRTADAHLRKAQHTEDQQRIQRNVDNSTKDLGQHGGFHIAFCLQDLGPDAFQKQAKAEHADDPSVEDNVFDDRRRIGGHCSIGRHDGIADNGENCPHTDGKGCSNTCIFLRILLFPDSQFGSHDSIDTDTGTNRQGDHQQLDGV